VGAELEQIRWWSWRRQRLDRSCRGIDDCLRSIVGVYGANPYGALSLLSRVPRVMPGMVDGAIDSHTAIRLPAMRRSVWMLHAETAHLAFRSLDQASAPLASLARAGITEKEYARLEHEILLAAGLPKTAEQIREAIKKPPEKLAAVLHCLCAQGKLLYIKQPAQTSKVFTYAATRVWLGHELPDADPQEALAWLAGDYLKGFGPATIEDFAWWSGALIGDAERALRAHEPEDIGDGLLMWPTDVRAFEGTRPFANRVNLLPALDPYLMGYAEGSRTRFADRELLPYLYDKNGVNPTSVILVEGAVAGLWDYTVGDRKIEIRVGLFEDPTPRAMEAIEAEVGLIAGYFNARDVKLTRVRIRNPIADRGPTAYLKPLAGQDVRPAVRPKAAAENKPPAKAQRGAKASKVSKLTASKLAMPKRAKGSA
jgi:winged helix DNA-binding protein